MCHRWIWVRKYLVPEKREEKCVHENRFKWHAVALRARLRVRKIGWYLNLQKWIIYIIKYVLFDIFTVVSLPMLCPTTSWSIQAYPWREGNGNKNAQENSKKKDEKNALKWMTRIFIHRCVRVCVVFSHFFPFSVGLWFVHIQSILRQKKKTATYTLCMLNVSWSWCHR